MKQTLLAQVVKIEQESKYPFKEGTTEINYLGAKIFYPISTVEILPNNNHIMGRISLPDLSLEYGQIVKIVVDTDRPLIVVSEEPQVVAMPGVSETLVEMVERNTKEKIA